jgi:hypothetical protein
MFVALTVISKRPHRPIDGAHRGRRRFHRPDHRDQQPLSEIIDGVIATLAAPLWSSNDHRIER